MIQRSKIDVICFPGVFDAMFMFGTMQSIVIQRGQTANDSSC